MNQKEVGKKIKMIRESQGLTREEFAKKLNVSIYTVANYEQGQRGSNTGTLRRIANALGVSTDDLLVKEPKNSAEKTISELYGETEEEYELRKNSYPNTLSEDGKVKELVDFMLMSTKIINSQLISEEEKKELREIFKTVVTQWSKCMNEDDHNRAIQIYNLYSNITKID